MNKQVSYKTVSLTFGILVACFVIGFYVLAWTEPTAVPPGDNVPAPINVGDIGQSKLGALNIKGGFESEGATLLATVGGNVGIGTTSPTTTLEIQAATPGLRIIPNANSRDANIYLYTTQTATDREWRIMAGTGGASPNTNFRIYDHTASADRLNINSAGNVGIGTTNPTAKLHVAGTAGTDGIKFPDGSLQTRATKIYSDVRDNYIELNSDVSWADLASVNLPVDFSGGKAYINFTAPIAKDGAFRLRLTLDGSPLTTTPAIDLDAVQNYLPGAIRGAPVALSYVINNLTAGAHTIKAQWIGFQSVLLPNLGSPAYYALLEAGSARVLTVITGE